MGMYSVCVQFITSYLKKTLPNMSRKVVQEKNKKENKKEFAPPVNHTVN